MGKTPTTETATLSGGCFWCTEAIFRRLNGVVSVNPGYSGGTVPHPTYEQVVTGRTGHAEAIQIVFDPGIISFDTLLDVFFTLHDPTTMNRQGADVGTQYRSAVFYHTEEQRRKAADTIRSLEASGTYKKIVTEVAAFTAFYPAEDYHKRYYEKNSYAPYCQVVIDPKISKLMAGFSKLVKRDA